MRFVVASATDLRDGAVPATAVGRSTVVVCSAANSAAGPVPVGTVGTIALHIRGATDALDVVGVAVVVDAAGKAGDAAAMTRAKASAHPAIRFAVASRHRCGDGVDVRIEFCKIS